MKKFIILMMSVVLLFSIFTMSACNNDEANTPTSSKSTSSSEEETSSETKATRRLNPDDNSNSTGSNGGGGGGGYTPTSSQPSTSAPSGVIGDSFYPKQVNVPENASTDVKMLIQMITYLEITPSNFREQESLLLDAELLYSQIPDKSQVINADDLTKAREAFVKLNNVALVNEFTSGVTTLPDAVNLKNANVEQVYALKDMLDKNRPNFSTNIPNFAELETKINACYNRVIDSLTESAIISQDMDGDGIVSSTELAQNKTMTLNKIGIFSIVGSSGGSSQSGCPAYSDKNHPTPFTLTRIFKGAVEFTATGAGTVTYYPRNQGKEFIVTLNGEKIGDSFIANTAGPAVVKVPSAGVVKVTTAKGDADAAFFAVKFNYPTLG